MTAKELNYVKLDESGKHSDHQQKEREAPGKNSPRVLDSEKESGKVRGCSKEAIYSDYSLIGIAVNLLCTWFPFYEIFGGTHNI